MNNETPASLPEGERQRADTPLAAINLLDSAVSSTDIRQALVAALPHEKDLPEDVLPKARARMRLRKQEERDEALAEAEAAEAAAAMAAEEAEAAAAEEAAKEAKEAAEALGGDEEVTDIDGKPPRARVARILGSQQHYEPLARRRETRAEARSDRKAARRARLPGALSHSGPAGAR